MTTLTSAICCNSKADNDGSNLAPLAKFIARQQLHAYFFAKNTPMPLLALLALRSSEFRRRRIEEAHAFIQQKASEITMTYGRIVTVEPVAGQGPFPSVVCTFFLGRY
jgi:hypothetical protein